jgi:CBS domain-containing protein
MILVEKILSVAQKRLVTIGNDALLTSAAGLLHQDGHINLAVVCDSGGVMAGVITKTDIIRQISACSGKTCTTLVAEVMSKNVTYCHPGDSLKEVWSIMRKKGLLHVPIVGEDFKPLGVINERDAIFALWEGSEYDETLMRDYVMGIGYR